MLFIFPQCKCDAKFSKISRLAWRWAVTLLSNTPGAMVAMWIAYTAKSRAMGCPSYYTSHENVNLRVTMQFSWTSHTNYDICNAYFINTNRPSPQPR